MIEKLKRLIELKGSAAAVAREMSVTAQIVGVWLKNGIVPKRYEITLNYLIQEEIKKRLKDVADLVDEQKGNQA